MTYVGAVPTTGDFKVLDSITTSSATTFNLRQGGVAVYPQSANHCLVVLNGVLQTAGSSFNIVNDTIVFASSLASSDVINQILVLGNVNDIGVPSDDTVSTAKLQSSAVTDAKISAMASSKLTGVVPTANLGSGTASSSTFLRGDQTYAEAGGGSLVYLGGINSSNYSASKLALQQVFSNDYRRYKVMGKFQGTGAGANVEFRWLNSSNSEMTSSYYVIAGGTKSNSASISAEEWFNWNTTKAELFQDTATGSHIHSFTMDLFPNQNENVNYPSAIFHTQGWDHNSGGNRQRVIEGSIYNEFTTSISGGGIQLESTSGLFGTVNMSIWGYKDS